MVRRIALARRADEFECICCGNCCRFRTIDLTKEDIKRIESAGHKGFHEKFGKGERLKRNKGRCVFVVDDKCSIHEIKPEICKKFPFFKLYKHIPYIHDWNSCPGVEELKKKTK
ncbi:MAG: YkgJ family cysteine cluster protein [Candidatus Altiarchaeota archaeon]